MSSVSQNNKNKNKRKYEQNDQINKIIYAKH